MHQHTQNTSERGQILLVTLMVLAVALSVGLTAIFTARSSTQSTKLEDDSQRALAAAEASVRAALKSQSATTLGSGDLSGFSGVTGGAAISTATSSNSFTSPSLLKDEQYTFYLGTYTAGSPPSFGNSTAENIVVCFASSSSVPALDIALIKGSGSSATVVRYTVDPQSRISSAPAGNAGCSVSATGASQFSRSYTIPAADIGTDTRLMLIKTLYAPTRVMIYRASAPFPVQGVNVTSEATTQTKVTKKVQVFQSYPQVPADVFGINW